MKIAIIGAGLSGLITSIGFAQYNIPVTVFEKSPTIPHDPRATSLNFQSVEILKKYGIWEKISEFATAIQDIYVLDNYSDTILHFAHEDAFSSSRATATEYMGYIIENNILRPKLLELAQQISSITIEYDVSEIDFKLPYYDLVLACDGKFSYIRQKFFQEFLASKSYLQHSMIFNIQHEKPHNNSAIEHFMTRGPFAVLPLKNPHQSSIVWTETSESAHYYANMNKEELSLFLSEKIGYDLGNIEIITEIMSYPLSAHITKTCYYKNIILIADSSHSIHPLAGQGLNFGILDIDAAISLVRTYYNLGLKIDSLALEKYAKKRFWHNLLALNAMDMLNFLFSNNSFLMSKIRKLGMSLINHLPIAKKYLMNKAMSKKSTPLY